MIVVMEKTMFLSVVGDSPVTRVLDFMITGRGLDYSLSDIARNSTIGWTTLHRIWPDFEKNHLVVQTRTIGKAKLYKINQQNSVAKELIRLYDTIIANKIPVRLAPKVILPKS